MDAHAKAFKVEAYDILTELETTLLELEETPDDTGLIDNVFRAIHTIKGSGSMFGFDAIAEFTHNIETALENVREGLLPVTPEIIRLTLTARDKILELLDNESNDLDEESLGIISEFLELCGCEVDEQQPEEEIHPDDEKKIETTVTYRIRFEPFADIFATGTNPLLLLTELQEMGECIINVYTDNIPMMADCDPELCYVFWDIILTTDQDENTIRDVFLFVEDKCHISIDVVYVHDDVEDCDQYRRLGEILVDRGDVTTEELQEILDDYKKIGERLVDNEVIDSSKVNAALAEQEHVRKVLEKEKKFSLSSIRVDSRRLDSLVDLVGELVTVQARLTQKASGNKDTELHLIAESVERLTEELRDNTMSIRMVPIGTLFSRFRRLIHDLSKELEKQVQMTTEGSSTELDKTVIDQLNEPMVHLIRNAIDHGIELPSARESAGKPPTGTIHLAAHHAGASVILEISDDGVGLDARKLKEKAVDMGLVSTEDDLDDEQCFAQIFTPGVSTADRITGVSGRGVGMDVVKTSINKLQGTISISSSQGSGTTISLKLPLTLAIIEGLLVGVGSDLFVIPLSVIEECVELTRDEAAFSRERSMMTFRGEAFPYLSLRQCFEIDGEMPEIEKVIIVNERGNKTGLGVDQVIGQHQTVIKTLSRVYGDVEGITGATILGDGTVALILDVNQLITAVKNDIAHWDQHQARQQVELH